jgi:hypothetical protein
MDGLTDEQLEYINNKEKIDTKLIACAGSGKTKCIILKISNIIKTEQYKNENILMLTFSKFTKDDFINKIKKYNIDNINETCIKTIDSFAKSLIDSENNIDVSLLSYKFMKYLENNDTETLKNNNYLDKIKCIFVDEAQDLNEIQYNIFINLKKKLGIILNFVGDPNQNIYQFRGSSDKYFLNFEAKTFYLTNNFRSHKNIVDFSDHLRPVKNTNITCKVGTNNLYPIFYFHENENELSNKLICIIKNLVKNNVKLHNVAILSPTRGRMVSKNRSHGLCFITNLLFKKEIKFIQFYEESNDNFNTKISYQQADDHINVLTYMGSKGLEWEYVILIDADTCLINKNNFDEEQHKNDQYLLYVASSRAIKNMFVFSKYYNNNGDLYFNTNKWFSLIPNNLYIIDTHIKNIKYKKIEYNNKNTKNYNIIQIINGLNEEKLNILFDIIHNNCEKNIEKIYDVDKQYSSELNKFITEYMENIFYAFYAIKNNLNKKVFPEIENIIYSTYIIDDLPTNVIEWYFTNKNKYTWNKFDENKDNIDEYIYKTINLKFKREHEFKNHIIIKNSYYKSFILKKKNKIKKIYEKYLKCVDYDEMKEILFYILNLVYSLDTQHYFHFKNNGAKFKDNINYFTDVFENIKNFIDKQTFKINQFKIYVEKWNLTNNIDLILDNDGTDTLWKISCYEITLKNIIQHLFSNIMYFDIDINENNNFYIIDLNFIDIIKGDVITNKLSFTYEDISTIFKTMDIKYDDIY